MNVLSKSLDPLSTHSARQILDNHFPCQAHPRIAGNGYFIQLNWHKSTFFRKQSVNYHTTNWPANQMLLDPTCSAHVLLSNLQTPITIIHHTAMTHGVTHFVWTYLFITRHDKGLGTHFILIAKPLISNQLNHSANQARSQSVKCIAQKYVPLRRLPLSTSFAE